MAEKPRAIGKDFHEFLRVVPDLEFDVLCQDPLVRQKRQRLGFVTIKLSGERYLEQGPRTARVEVIDCDEDTGKVYEPVPVLRTGKGYAVGDFRNDYRSNHFFHQVNVWAIINRTLALLEEPEVLGRPVRWASGKGRLVVMPHAGRGANAYYDPKAGALKFLYFGAAEEPVLSCLSHDIITHELGHAVLDGLKPGYDAVSTPESAGFHEYFGDALALASALTFRDVWIEAVGHAPEKLDVDFLDSIGEEFGMADSRGDRGYIRRFSEKVSLTDLAQVANQNAHDHSQVLSGVFFELLQFLYDVKLDETKARSDGRLNGHVAVKALILAAKQATRTMLCAVDYCPPVGVSFLDYARAVLRADEVAFPKDKDGVRLKIAQLFNARGIGATPADLERPTPYLQNRNLYTYDVDALSATDEAAYRFLDENRHALGIPYEVNFRVVRRYRTRKMTANRYFPPREIVLEFVWSEDVPIANEPDRFGTLAGGVYALHCGGTVVLDVNGNVLHYVLVKADDTRKAQLTEYLAYLFRVGQIGMPDQAGAPIVALRDGDRVRLERRPRLRHDEPASEARVSRE